MSETSRSGGIVSGVVQDASGQPVAGARAFFSAGPGPFPDVAALTDAQGRFTLSAPEAGTYELTCAGDAGPPATRTIDVAPGSQTAVEIRLSA